ncbi:uncharacterized protein [Hyperolius riggenbachi]|uniref:uncharacterized protein isoform X3 n=1 Tax=Hyperolius riggenbachi TaxID=752182 RepID=UPI0035A348A4
METLMMRTACLAVHRLEGVELKQEPQDDNSFHKCEEFATLSICAAKEQTCVDTSLCMTEGEKQENKSSEDKWLLLRHSLCSEPVSNCLFTENGDYRCSLEKSQNKTAIYDLKDCWTHTSKTSNLTTEVRFSLLLLLSFVTLFLSYVGLRRALHRILARQEKTSFHLRPTRPGDTETV